MFEQQKILRDRIAYNEQDRFNKLILALLVELGECANEWRGFKFWSKNQEPRNKNIICHACKGQGYFAFPNQEEEDCSYCEGSGYQEKNPLLEEYVDGLHFVLELGIEVNCEKIPTLCIVPDNAVDQFNELFYQVSHLNWYKNEYGFNCVVEGYFEELFGNYMNLGKLLGFTWNEIEQAYFEKNQINHERQNNGY